MISIKFVRAIKFLQAEMSGRAPGSTQARELRTDRGFHPSSSGGARHTCGSPRLRPTPRLVPPKRELLEEKAPGRAATRRQALQKHAGFFGGSWFGVRRGSSPEALRKRISSRHGSGGEGTPERPIPGWTREVRGGGRWLTKGIHGVSHRISLPPAERSAANCIWSPTVQMPHAQNKENTLLNTPSASTPAPTRAEILFVTQKPEAEPPADRARR